MNGEAKDVLNAILTTAKIHESRLQAVMTILRDKVPLNQRDVSAFTMEDYLHWDMFVLRFSKLQDLMGTKLFKVFLEYIGQPTETYTLIDCLHILEKLQIVANAQDWKDVREMRNHLSHEYPNAPELTALYLNQAYNLAPKLIKVLRNLENFIKELQERNQF